MIRQASPCVQLFARTSPISIPRPSSSPQADSWGTPYAPLPSTLYPHEHIFVLLDEDQELLLVAFNPYSTMWGPQILTTYRTLYHSDSDEASILIRSVLSLTGLRGKPNLSRDLAHINRIMHTDSITVDQLGEWKLVAPSYMNVHVGDIRIHN